MFINSLKLESYRNYISQDISFINGINLFIGNNAQGKTNILEAIYLLSFLKSYRTHKDNELINFNCEFLRVNSSFNKNNEDINIEIYVDNDKKIAKKNDVVIKK
ncbi:MAG: AAA family ATPase, partial [Clostridia bacterium]